MHNVLMGSTAVDSLSVDSHGRIQAFGTMAQRLLSSGFRVEALRTCATLRKDEWIQLDNVLLEVARQRLRLVRDLMERNLTYNLTRALGKTRVEWESVSDMTDAEISMSGLKQSQDDRPNFELIGMPIPIIHKAFSINIRALEASRERGEALDTTSLALASRLVVEKIEELFANGGYSVGTNGTIYGYTNAPNRNTGSVTASWALAATSGENIVSDAIEMVGVAHADYMFGPYGMYVPALAYVNFADDYKAESDRTILERLNAIPSIESIAPSDNFTASNVVLVQFTRDVIDMVNGFQPTVVQWDEEGGMKMNFKVMAIMLPRPKYDQELKSGIVHYS